MLLLSPVSQANDEVFSCTKASCRVSEFPPLALEKGLVRVGTCFPLPPFSREEGPSHCSGTAISELTP